MFTNSLSGGGGGETNIRSLGKNKYFFLGKQIFFNTGPKFLIIINILDGLHLLI